MSKYKVAIIPQEKYDSIEIASKIGTYLDDQNIDFTNKTIFLKPSFVFPVSDQDRTIAVNTNTALVAGVVQAFSERKARSVIIAEHRTMGRARYAFSMVGIKEAVKDIHSVKFYYLDEKRTQRVVIENPFIKGNEIKYPKILLDETVDYFVSLPKLKGNNYAGITLSIKNNLGLISKKERLKHHDDLLHEHLADITLIRQPDLIITDAVVSGEGNGPAETDPVKTNMLIVSENCLAADITCCYLVEKDPGEIRHIRLLSERGIGPLDINEVEISNKDYLDSKRKKFNEPDLDLNVHPGLKIYKGKNICNQGCVAFIRSYLDSYGRGLGWDVLSGMTIIVGKDHEIPDEELNNLVKRKTIVYGDCAKKFKKYGVYFKGCPPDYIKAIFKISLRTKLPYSPYFQYLSYPKLIKTWIVYLLQRVFRF